MSIPAKPRKSWIFGVLIGVLVISLSVFGVYAAKKGASSEMAEVDYGTLGQLMGEMSKVEEDKGEIANEALEKLFDEIKTHLESKEEVPGHVVETFQKRTSSLLMLDRAGVLSSNQVASEASQIVESAGRQDPDGKVPGTVLEKLGVDEDSMIKLKNGGITDLEVAEVARKMAQDKQEQNKQKKESVEEETETQERNRETKEVKSQEQKEEKAKEQSQEKKGKSSQSQEKMGNEKGKKTGNSQKGKPKDTPGNSKGNNDTEDQNIDREEVSSSDVNQKEEQPEEVGQEQGGPGNSGSNPGNSGNKGKGNGDKGKGEKEDDENPGKGKGRGKGKGGK